MNSFSVVIPLFNKEKRVARSVQSILAQSHEEFEILIVDDCSTDGSLQEVKKFTDPRIRIFSTGKNSGPSRARNLGVSEALNGFIVFLDADDVMGPQYLFSLNQASLRFPDVSVFSSAYTHHLPKLESSPADNWEELPRLAYQSSIISGRRILTASSVCCKKQVFEKVGGFNEGLRISEDPDFFCRLSYEFNIVYSPSTQVLYDVSDPDTLARKPLNSLPLPYFETMSDLVKKSPVPILRKYFFNITLKILILMKKDRAQQSEIKKLMYFMNEFPLKEKIILNALNLFPDKAFSLIWKLRR